MSRFLVLEDWAYQPAISQIPEEEFAWSLGEARVMNISSKGPDDWECHYTAEGRECLIVVTIKDGKVEVVDGPLESRARSHEAMGGVQSYEAFLTRPSPWVESFPGLASFVRKVVASRCK